MACRVDANILIERQPGGALGGSSETRDPRVRQFANRADLSKQQPPMKPFAGPPGIRGCPGEPRDRIERDDRPSLHQHARLAQLSLEKRTLRFAIPPHAVLAPAERPAAVKHVTRRGVEIQAGGVVPVVELAAPVGIRLQILPSPCANLLAKTGWNQE